MSTEYHNIRAVHNRIQGQIAQSKDSSITGIVIGEFNENNQGWQVLLSLDDTPKIEFFSQEDLVLLGYCGHYVFLERLIRDINSPDLTTRQWASEILCYFIEYTGSKLDIAILYKAIDNMISRLELETNYDVEQKLSEGIFEFIWLEKLEHSEERHLIIRLAQINKDTLFPYLDDEEYLAYEEVRAFISRGRH